MRNEDEENVNASYDNYDKKTPSLIHPGLSARHMPTAGITDPNCRPHEDSPIVSLKALSPRREDPLAYIRDPKCYEASTTVMELLLVPLSRKILTLLRFRRQASH